MTRSVMRRIRRRALAGEAGSVTALNLILLIVISIFGGIAIDVSNLIASRTQLQVTADAAAHAALYTRLYNDADVARARAVEIAESSMPPSVYGEVLRPEHVQFGRYDAATREFTVDETSRDAVLIETMHLAQSGNAVTSFLLGFIGFQDFDVISNAVFTTYVPKCLREGYMAVDEVDVTSNNQFRNGFCIHSNDHVALQNNNSFENNVFVSMPRMNDLVIPSGGMNSNPGLQNTLREWSYAIHVERWLDDWWDAMLTPGSPHYRDFISQSVAIPLNLSGGSNSFAPSAFLPGRAYDLTCSNGNGKITLPGGTYRRLVIRTNCKVEFGSNVELNDVTIFTSNTRTNSITAPSGLKVGADDGCADGGGAQLLTYGGMSFSSGLEIYGGQLVALGDVSFTANAGSVDGVSILAGGSIRGTANGEVGLCGTGWASNFLPRFIRMRT